MKVLERERERERECVCVCDKCSAHRSVSVLLSRFES